MKQAAALGLLLLASAGAASGLGIWRFSFAAFHGEYVIYGGELGDPVAPTERSKNIAFSVNGKAAQQMFDAMGPDLKAACGTEDGARVRQRSELICSYRRSEGYECNFGIDLVEGRSIGGSVC
jgi:hypothetical protein